MNGEPTRGAKRQARNLQWSVTGLCLWARAMSRHSSNASHVVYRSAKIVLKAPYLSANPLSNLSLSASLPRARQVPSYAAKLRRASGFRPSFVLGYFVIRHSRRPNPPFIARSHAMPAVSI